MCVSLSRVDCQLRLGRTELALPLPLRSRGISKQQLALTIRHSGILTARFHQENLRADRLTALWYDTGAYYWPDKNILLVVELSFLIETENTFICRFCWGPSSFTTLQEKSGSADHFNPRYQNIQFHCCIFTSAPMLKAKAQSIQTVKNNANSQTIHNNHHFPFPLKLCCISRCLRPQALGTRHVVSVIRGL